MVTNDVPEYMIKFMQIYLYKSSKLFLFICNCLVKYENFILKCKCQWQEVDHGTGERALSAPERHLDKSEAESASLTSQVLRSIP